VKTFDELKSLIEKRGVHPEFGDPGELWGIEQNSFELATFLCRMQELGVQSVLEIGTGYKGGLSRFLAHDMGWDVTTVDFQNYGHVFEGVHYIILPGKHVKAYVLSGRFTPPSVDLVFIDGDHSYESVLADYEVYFKVAEKAIAFHDIEGLRGCEGVKQFWDKTFKPEKKNQIVSNSLQSGIGWIEL
jgi:hypothetical protein